MKTIQISKWLAAAMKTNSFQRKNAMGTKASFAFVMLLLGAFNLSAQVQSVGTIPAGGSVTIEFEVTINDPLPAGITAITNQGSFSGANFTTILTDDPDSFLLDDPTVTLLPADLDYGDAPAPYPTLLANDGARHVLPFSGVTLFLGLVAPDIDTNGQPHASAQGDDLIGTDDEEGVTLPAAFLAAFTSNVTVRASAAGVLNAWIDWNRDGDWDDAGEQIATNRAMSAGVNVVGVLAPTNTAGGGSFTRFRLSSASGLTPRGEAPDGEVEDYAVTLASNTPPVAVNDTLGTLQNRAVQVGAFKLLSNDTDADGDVLSIIGVTATSTNGGSVVLASGTITYTPLGALTNLDRFTYTNSDGRGGMATGIVLVTVTSSNNPSLNVVFGPTIDGTDFVVRFAGIPGQTYTIEATDSFSPVNWQKKTNLIAPTINGGFGIGVFEFRENKGAATQRFYRTVHPAY